MSLLRDIQRSAIDANEPIGNLLRKCKVLAARLGNSDFKEWVEHELNGYKEEKDIPAYRVMTVMSKGSFYGAYGSKMENAEIPSLSVPDDFREDLFTLYIQQPVPSVEDLINKSTDFFITQPWSADITSLLATRIHSNMRCLQAWKVIPVNALVGMLDIIRNKVLDFSMEIEAENPEAGDASMNSKPLPEEKVSQIFNTYITGEVQNLATGSNNVNQHAVKNENNQLFNEMLQALSKASGDHKSKEKMIGAVEEMRDSQGSNVFREKYTKFISVLSDHMQVYGPVVAPFLPVLSSL